MKKLIIAGLSLIILLNINSRGLAQEYDSIIHTTFLEETEGIVILKNYGGLLPLHHSNIKILTLIDPAPPGSDISSFGTIKNSLSDSVKIYSAMGANASISLAVDSMFKEAVAKARWADVAIVFVGQANSFNGDGDVLRNRDIQNQSRLIRAVYEANPNTIVVLQTASAVDIEDWAFDIPAIIQAWTPKQESGAAIADVLFGNIDPSGKLPFRWTMNENQNFMTRFPFGHGLSYTTIGIGKLMMRRNQDGSGWTATVETKNMGSRTGTEFLHVYVNHHERKTSMTERQLKAFRRVKLQAGQKKIVSIQLPYEAFSSLSKEMNTWNIDPGLYDILVGTSAEDIKLRKTIE
ncbi:MAG: glycoside hydrolase family 3 C-terminal domain-containing protein, partial [Bacteroidota bacterium]